MTVMTDQERIARLEFVLRVLIERLPGNEALTVEQSTDLLDVLKNDDLVPVPAYLRKPK